jgi:hypothetical protein
VVGAKCAGVALTKKGERGTDTANQEEQIAVESQRCSCAKQANLFEEVASTAETQPKHGTDFDQIQLKIHTGSGL